MLTSKGNLYQRYRVFILLSEFLYKHEEEEFMKSVRGHTHENMTTIFAYQSASSKNLIRKLVFDAHQGIHVPIRANT